MEMTNLGYCTADTGVIAALADKPNEAGMTAAQLKAKFDAAGADIKAYINDTLVPYINGTIQTALAENAVDIDNTVAAMHSHENKALLDSYTVSNGTIEGTVEKSHTHDNMDVLGSFTKPMRELMEEIYANAKLDAHPVGSVYISEVDTSPEELFGGTWERIKDTFLLAAGDTYTAGDSGGEATHTLTESEMPKHRHYLVDKRIPYWNYSSGSSANYDGKSYSHSSEPWTSYTGGSAAHNNMPPYKVYYMWVRTA